MNLARKTMAAFGLAVLTFGTLATTPASAQIFHGVRHHQVRKAAVLDRKAAHAASTGHYRRATRLRRRAAHLRASTRHGF